MSPFPLFGQMVNDEKHLTLYMKHYFGLYSLKYETEIRSNKRFSTGTAWAFDDASGLV